MLTRDAIDTRLRQAQPEIDDYWDNHIIPVLSDYIAIPNKSVEFDPDWKAHGYMDEAMALLKRWAEQQPIQGMHMDLLELEGRTPLLLIDIPATDPAPNQQSPILLYGHMDKQPEMTGWREGLGPWTPVLKDGKLYGRGGADDGYSTFCALTAIATLQRHAIPHARCVIIIEASEESGSCDLPFYLEQIKDRLGSPNLVICLDSGCLNYEQLWNTTSLRGISSGVLSIKLLRYGMHSGIGGGTVPSIFSVLRQLLDRLENSQTEQLLLSELDIDIPQQRIAQAQHTAEQLGDAVFKKLALLKGVQPTTLNGAELLLRQSWHPSLSVTGIDGVPPIANAGNVSLPSLQVKLVLRTPPTCDSGALTQRIQQLLTENPPYNAIVEYKPDAHADGWHAPELAPWLAEANDNASQLAYGKPAGYVGEGGTIPFMGMLGAMLPDAQFAIMGVLGPKSNAHGPNEFLHIPYVKKLTACVASIVADHSRYHR